MEPHPGRVTGYPLVVPPISAWRPRDLSKPQGKSRRFMGRAGVWSNLTTTFDRHL